MAPIAYTQTINSSVAPWFLRAMLPAIYWCYAELSATDDCHRVTFIDCLSHSIVRGTFPKVADISANNRLKTLLVMLFDATAAIFGCFVHLVGLFAAKVMLLPFNVIF
jgi:hypothetical protein